MNYLHVCFYAKSEVVRKATMTTNGKISEYTGCTDSNLRTRIANRDHSFGSLSLKYFTSLSKFTWQLQDANKNYIYWDVIIKARAYKIGESNYSLCAEKSSKF